MSGGFVLSFLLLLQQANVAASPMVGPVATVPGITCFSDRLSADQKKQYFESAKRSEPPEKDIFHSLGDVRLACQKMHGWSDIQARNAFRVALLDYFGIAFLDRAKKQGYSRQFLDAYYDQHSRGYGKNGIDQRWQSGDLKRDLQQRRLPADEENMEIAFAYWEWRDALDQIEADFQVGKLRR